MADLLKFLTDDHARIRRAMGGYKRSSTLDAALSVVDHLRIHAIIEAELLQPLIQTELTARDAEMEAAAHGQIDDFIESIERFQSDDPALHDVMANLEQLVKRHVLTEERSLFPQISALGEQQGLGRLAFARWQELVAEQAPRGWSPMTNLANTGWGGGGRIANAGW